MLKVGDNVKLKRGVCSDKQREQFGVGKVTMVADRTIKVLWASYCSKPLAENPKNLMVIK